MIGRDSHLGCVSWTIARDLPFSRRRISKGQRGVPRKLATIAPQAPPPPHASFLAAKSLGAPRRRKRASRPKMSQTMSPPTHNHPTQSPQRAASGSPLRAATSATSTAALPWGVIAVATIAPAPSTMTESKCSDYCFYSRPRAVRRGTSTRWRCALVPASSKSRTAVPGIYQGPPFSWSSGGVI